MFTGLGQVVTRRSRLILVVAAIAVLVAAGIGFGAPAKLRGGGFTDPSSSSELARTQLDASGAGQPNLAASCARPYWRAVDSVCSRTCIRVDCRM